ncbi:zinc finger protein 470-like [Topomyia yanbarensis]|uniref:zinc finger protein 470-like n=1 Tax=Topomyia yanbarensis TaxID=2498891 RepID=UPI00273BDBF2|nr:zinc finger protein 470-like [Topomyia yanbarensis]
MFSTNSHISKINMDVINIPSEDPSSYCRLCFSVRNLVPLLSNTGELDTFLLNLIAQCTGIQIDSNDNLPGSICWRCAVALEDFQLFRERSLQHDTIIRESHATKYEIESIISDGSGSGYKLDEPQAMSTVNPLEGELSAVDDGVVSEHDETGISIKSVQCNMCTKRCESEAMLWIHFKQQHSDDGRPFQCTICPASFKQKNHLECHIASHSTYLRYTCDQCGANYAKSKSLTMHRQQIHGLKPTRKTSSVTGISNQCPHCSKTFKRRHLLNLHIKTHNKMLTFKCELCNARFDSAVGKLIHKGKYHTVEVRKKAQPTKNMFECVFCTRTFEQQNHLTQHVKYRHFPKDAKNRPAEDNDRNIVEEVEAPVTVKFEVDEDVSSQFGWD